MSLVPSNHKSLHRFGGISAIALFIGYIIIIGLYTLTGPLPSGAEETLQHLAKHITTWWGILWLSVITDLLFLPIMAAIYTALKEKGKNILLTGISLVGLFVFLDLAITWPNYSTLITLASQYATASSEIQHMVLVTIANHVTAILSSTLLATYIILVPGIGMALIGLTMLRGVFNKATAYIGIATGILGTIAVMGPFFLPTLGAAAILASVLTTIWVLLVGWKLLQLSKG